MKNIYMFDKLYSVADIYYPWLSSFMGNIMELPKLGVIALSGGVFQPDSNVKGSQLMRFIGTGDTDTLREEVWDVLNDCIPQEHVDDILVEVVSTEYHNALDIKDAVMFMEVIYVNRQECGVGQTFADILAEGTS